ncbi:hypothetical protein M1K46_25090 [Fictibacillus sp. WQ 8-8]|uniref:hypothetical protein n=1 Tax=Fictibacillus sp. WQ 8-8 TaxID=2938788 RepID=UPI002108DE1B|nr:hypothetical protein [Fictibacillus sp. WQ 8-8]MCQ6268838.1 hypothetical protein [Fictibacillus sp. WQ 8-8]
MARFFNVHEALKILSEHRITDSIQMVTRYIREGRIKAETIQNRKDGYRIHEDDLYDFIKEIDPEIVWIMDAYKNDYIPSLLTPGQRRYVHKAEKRDEQINTEETLSNPNIVDIDERLNKIEEELCNITKAFENEDTAIDERKITDIIDKKIVDVKKRTSELEEKHLSLLEIIQENKGQLNAIMEGLQKRDHQQLKIARPKKSEQKGEKGEFPYTLIEFKEQIKELAAEHNWGYDEKNDSQFIDEYYHALYKDGKINPDQRNGEGQIKCPFTLEKHKYLRTLLKTAIPAYLKSKRGSQPLRDLMMTMFQKQQSKWFSLINKNKVNKKERLFIYTGLSLQ